MTTGKDVNPARLDGLALAVADYFKQVPRSTLFKLSQDERLGRIVENLAVGHKIACRFVAGSTLTEALGVAAVLNAQGFAVTLDHLGEEVSSVMGAELNADDYAGIFSAITSGAVNADVAVKLTALGLAFDAVLAHTLAEATAVIAEYTGNALWLDMEGSRYTRDTIDIVCRVASQHPGVGVALQAALRSSASNLTDLIRAGVRVRLVKGAYLEPADIAFQAKADVDEQYRVLSNSLLDQAEDPAFGTHDERMVDWIRSRADAIGRDRKTFEFQMLFGIRRDLQQRLAADGYRVRIYVPYGTNWYPYFVRRLAERPANVLFVLRSLALEGLRTHRRV